MALSRRNGSRFEANIWPGFVDAMTALLLVLVFVLSIFMILQFTLSQTISSQDVELDELGNQVLSLADALGLEQEKADGLDAELAAKSAELDTKTAFIATLSAQNDDQNARIEDFEQQVIAFLSSQNTLEERLAALTVQRDAATESAQNLTAQLEDAEAGLARELSLKEAAQLALAQTRDEVDVQAEQARLAAAKAQALETMVARLNDEQAAKTEKLAEEEAARLAEIVVAEDLRDKLKNADAELTAMSLTLEEKRRQAEETLTLLAAARAAESQLNDRLARALTDVQTSQTEAAQGAGLRDQLAAALAAQQSAQDQAGEALTQSQQQQILLSAARDALADEQDISAQGQLKVEALNQQIAQLRTQLNQLQGVLNASADRDTQAEVQIESLGSQLNAALAQAASEQRKRAELEAAERARLEAEAGELENYRSEFFGQLRALLGDLDGVRIEGDRFVFSSEVLFSPASADLSDEGIRDITKVAIILQQVAGEIPNSLDWIIRVDGHTDDVPLGPRSRYADNWELSQARALSVVRFMSDELGIPPQRMAANGFGEFQPINRDDTDEARAQNRRIELKLTER